MQKLIFFLIAILFIAITSVQAQSKEVKFLLDTTFAVMQKHAINTKNVNWKKLKEDTYKKAERITDPAELEPIIVSLYQALDDFHGTFFYKDKQFKWLHNVLVTSDSIKAEWTKGTKVISQVLDNNIGYLRIPGMGGYTGKEGESRKAQNLNDHLCSLLEKNIKGIVLDLRLNGGGAMYPMILGVEQLLGQGKLGAFHTNFSQEDWFIKNNDFIVDTTTQASIVPGCTINAENMPVVMLVSSATGSSGEFLVLAFKGRKNTILLGSETAGYVTSIQGFKVTKDASILLSTGYGSDRNGEKYTNALKPDISFTATYKFNDIPNDETVKAAVVWLTQHSK